MPRLKTKTKSEDLARIRNNQQRSRARRQEYVRNLEKRIKEYEEIFSSEEWPDQSTLQHLRTENDLMKRLLDSLGLSQTQWGQLMDHGLDHLSPPLLATAQPTLSESLVIPAGAQLPGSFHNLGLSNELHFSLDTMDIGIPAFNALQPPIEAGLNPLDIVSAESNYIASGSQWVGQVTETRDHTNEHTTLCSLAYRWVVQCNSRNLDLQIISDWMQHGFQPGRNPMEGCRINNQILLAVLTEIS